LNPSRDADPDRGQPPRETAVTASVSARPSGSTGAASGMGPFVPGGATPTPSGSSSPRACSPDDPR